MAAGFPVLADGDLGQVQAQAGQVIGQGAGQGLAGGCAALAVGRAPPCADRVPEVVELGVSVVVGGVRGDADVEEVPVAGA